MRLDDTVCVCYGVTLRKIVNYVQRERPPVASLISECLSAGTGCGWCVPFLKMIHREVMAGNLAALEQLDLVEYEKLRAGWLEESSPTRDPHYADGMLCGQPLQPAANGPPATKDADPR